MAILKNTYKESLQAGLEELLLQPTVYLFGEDISEPYGGAYQITKGMSDKFPGKLINTPMSEQAFTGIGVGMALAGFRPIIEIMFGDFVTLTLDQMLNHASKFVEGFEKKIHLVLRAPMGGYRGYGATHSQSLEKIYMGLPNIAVIAPSVLHSPGQLLINSMNLGLPVLFVENKLDYTRKMFEYEKIALNFNINYNCNDFPICEVSIKDELSELIIISYGGLVNPILNMMYDLYIEEEIPIKLVAISAISPLNFEELAKIVSKSKIILIIEEGHIPFGFGDAVVSNLIQNGIFAKFKTIGAKLSIIGASKSMEAEVLPNFYQIKNQIIEMVNEG